MKGVASFLILLSISSYSFQQYQPPSTTPCTRYMPNNTVSYMPLGDWINTYGTGNFAPNASSWVCPKDKTIMYDGVDPIAINVLTYGLKGDGVTLNDAAMKRLMEENIPQSPTYGVPRPLYFPKGKYKFSNTISWPLQDPAGTPNWLEGGAAGGCCVSLRGDGVGATIIQLADNAVGFQNKTTGGRKSFIITKRGNKSFRQYVRDVTIEVGKNNGGAMALDYISNNRGSVRDVRIVAKGDAFSGLEMTRDWPGPCLIKRVAIEGFDYGIRTRTSEYGPTFEHIVLKNQKVAGIHNDGNVLSMRGITSVQNAAPTFNLTASGLVIVLDSKFNYTGARSLSAIVNKGDTLYLRNVTVIGYTSSVNNNNVTVPSLPFEYFFNPKNDSKNKPVQLFNNGGNGGLSLQLPIKETPLPFWSQNPKDWYGVQKGSNWCFGSTYKNLAGALNSSRPCIYFGMGANRLVGGDYVIPRTVRLIAGTDTMINSFSPAPPTVSFYVTGDSSDPPLVFDSINFRNDIRFYHNSSRTVVFISCNIPKYYSFPGSGDLFIEDGLPTSRVGDGGAVFLLEHPQNVYMRQFNPETLGSPNYKIINRGANLWILGIKTEGVGTIIRTESGGRTELLGTLIYTVTDQSDPNQAAFEVIESSASHLYLYTTYKSTSYFPYHLVETQEGITRRVSKNELDRKILTVSFAKNWRNGNTTRLCSTCTSPGSTNPPSGTCNYNFLGILSDSGEYETSSYLTDLGQTSTGASPGDETSEDDSNGSNMLKETLIVVFSWSILLINM